MAFCPSCGKEVPEGVNYCPSCGSQLTKLAHKEDSGGYKNFSTKGEGIAAVLSFLVPGLGQIYVGRIGRGISLFVLGIVVAVVSVFLLLIPYLVFFIWNTYDAYNLAKQYNAQLSSSGKPPW